MYHDTHNSYLFFIYKNNSLSIYFEKEKKINLIIRNFIGLLDFNFYFLQNFLYFLIFMFGFHDKV